MTLNLQPEALSRCPYCENSSPCGERWAKNRSTEGGHVGVCLLYVVFHIEKKNQGLMMKKKKKVSLLRNNHE